MPLDPNKLHPQDPGGPRRRPGAAREAQPHPGRRPSTCCARCSASPRAWCSACSSASASTSKAVRDRVDEALGPPAAGLRRDRRTRSSRPRRTGCSRRPTASARDLGDDYLSTEHLLLAMTEVAGGVGDLLRVPRRHARRGARRARRRCAAATASRARTPRSSTRRSSASAATSPRTRARASSTRSSGATRRSGASSRCCRAARRTTRCSSASPASARPRSPRGSRAASSKATCPKGLRNKRVDRARHRLDGRGLEVPRRVRGAAQGRAQGDRRLRRRGHHVHRRAAHDRRRRRRRRRGRRRQHDQADARARRAAHDRRDHARRVPQVHREGRRARAPVPAGVRGRAVGRGHDRDPARA